MIRVQSAIGLHDRLIESFGGSKGVRDESSLESALARPFATFDGADLYPTSFEKAAAIFESLIINHPFVDGNKPIAYAFMEIFMRLENFEIVATEDEKYNFVIEASTGKIRFDEIKLWIESKCKSDRL